MTSLYCIIEEPKYYIFYKNRMVRIKSVEYHSDVVETPFSIGDKNS